MMWTVWRRGIRVKITPAPRNTSASPTVLSRDPRNEKEMPCGERRSLMDPNVVLRAMIEHLAEGERDGALDALDTLRDWLMGGGFLPEQAARELAGEGRQGVVRRLSSEVQQRLDEVDRRDLLECSECSEAWYVDGENGQECCPVCGEEVRE
jgi:hypothetical protein